MKEVFVGGDAVSYVTQSLIKNTSTGDCVVIAYNTYISFSEHLAEKLRDLGLNVVCNSFKNDNDTTYKNAEILANELGLNVKFVITVKSNGRIRWKKV